MRSNTFIGLALPFLAVAASPVGPSPLLVRYLQLGDQSQARLLASDSAGNLFAVSTVVKPSGRPQIRVIKTDPQGNVLASFDIGGSSRDVPNGAAVDPRGDLVIVGRTASSDFPLVSSLFSKTTAEAGFVAKLDSELQHILFSTRLGGTQSGGLHEAGTSANSVAIDQAGNIYVTGTTSTPDFPVTSGAFQTAPPRSNPFGSASYAFVTEISAAGDRVVSSTYFGGSETNCNGGSICLGAFGQTIGNAIAISPSGAIVIGGSSSASKLPVTPGTLGPHCLCDNTIAAGFAAELAAGLGKLNWATYVALVQQGLDLQSDISILSIAIDSSGELILGGTAPAGFPVTRGALQTTYPGGNYPQYAGFVAKLDPAGTRFIFSTYLGGNVAGTPNGITSVAVDAQGTIWATGGSVLSEFPLPSGTPELGQTYVAGLSPDGTRFNSVFTAPDGAAGQAMVVTPQGMVAALGSAGSLLIGGSARSPSLVGVANSAAAQVWGEVAPFELISFYGVGLGPASPLSGRVVNGRLTTSLGGVQVIFDGVAAPLLYAGSSQINAIVPSAVALHDTTAVQIVTPEGTISGLTLFVAPSRPEVFGTLSSVPFSLKAAIALNQDGSLNSADHPAGPHSAVTVWATGGGLPGAVEADGEIVSGGRLTAPELPVAILTENGSDNLQSLEVLYEGDAPGMVAGVLQINFRLPAQFSLGTSQLTCALQIGDGLSELFGIYVAQ